MQGLDGAARHVVVLLPGTAQRADARRPKMPCCNDHDAEPAGSGVRAVRLHTTHYGGVAPGRAPLRVLSSHGWPLP